MDFYTTLEDGHACLEKVQKRLTECKKRAAKQMAKNADRKLPDEWDVAFGCLAQATHLVEQELNALEEKDTKKKPKRKE
jgi:hypothetical protein